MFYAKTFAKMLQIFWPFCNIFTHPREVDAVDGSKTFWKCFILSVISNHCLMLVEEKRHVVLLWVTQKAP